MTKLNLIVSTAAVVLFSACSPLDAKNRLASQDSKSSDFFISQAPADFKPLSLKEVAAAETREGCKAHLTKSVCETTATSNEIAANWESISCSANSQSYIPTLMSLYEEMPDLMRPSLCTLERVFISDGISSTAFASPIQAGLRSMPVGGFAGFRKSSFLQQPDATRLVSWKEQLVYGGSSDFLANDPKLVQVSYELKLQQLPQSGLFYVMIHELGHLIDFENNVNESCVSECHEPLKGWLPLSWRSQRSPLPESAFFKQDEFCYYNCPQHVDPLDALKIYQSLAQSAFVSTYAGVNSFEDFAETWAWYALRKFKSPGYKFVIPGQGEVDMMTAMDSNPKMKAKLDFVDKLWNSSDLKVAHGVR